MMGFNEVCPMLFFIVNSEVIQFLNHVFIRNKIVLNTIWIQKICFLNYERQLWKRGKLYVMNMSDRYLLYDDYSQRVRGARSMSFLETSSSNDFCCEVPSFSEMTSTKDSKDMNMFILLLALCRRSLPEWIRQWDSDFLSRYKNI